MQTRFTLFLSLLLFSTTGLICQDSFTLQAPLSGQQQVLPVATAASGNVSLSFSEQNDDEYELVVTGSFENLSSPVATEVSGGAHIHFAFPGRNGGIDLRLVPQLAADSLSGSFTAEANTYTVRRGDYRAAADSAKIYVNIHTENYPMGEIRGNVMEADREVYYTNLFGSNEVPSVISRAHGALLLSVDTSTDSLYVSGSFNNLADSLALSVNRGAHLHFGLPGENGDIDIVLNATLDSAGRGGIFYPANNAFKLSADQLTALRSGGYYANVHSLTYRSGEIRGQVLPPADLLFRAHLAGANEWPVVTSDASGQVLLHLVENTVRVIGTFGDLESPVAVNVRGGAHLHPGWAGENGGILTALTFALAADSLSGAFALADNVIELTDAQRTQMIDRGVYVNIHSREHQSGEIRGQVLPESQAVFTTFLNGNQQIPSITTRARGAVKVELMGNRMTATGSFLNLESDLATQLNGGAHFHPGYPGQAGPVLFPLTVLGTGDDEDRNGRFLPATNIFTITDGQIDTLTDRFFYVNVHSMSYLGGEIRGSVLAEAESYFLAPLSGASEPQGVPTDATGMVALEVVDTVITAVGSFKDLGSAFNFNAGGGAHLHRNIAGSNGDVVRPLNTEIDSTDRKGVILADSNRITLTSILYMDLRNRLLYANFHSVDNPNGEIRGQVLPLAGSYFHTTFSGVNEIPYVSTTAQGGLKLELIDSMLTVSGSVTDLEGDFDASVMGGAHLHFGGVGVNGTITIPLNSDADSTLKNVTFPADSNTYKLNTEQLTALLMDTLYANIHTTTNPMGEARGQILGELNLFPTASDIIAPEDEFELDLEGLGNQEFRATFSGSTDPDGDTINYVWQLAIDETFDTVIFAANTGRDSFFSTDFSTVDALLDSNMVAAGESITLYHRALASDGSNHRPGEVASITITRGVVTGTRNYLPQGFAARTYPNPSRGVSAVNLEISTQEAFRGRLVLYSQLGQLQQQRTVDVPMGTNNYPLQVSGLSAGQYFVTLRKDDGRLIHTARIVIQ